MTSSAKKLPVQQAERRWDHRKFGTLEDPVHKSQLSSLVGEFACTKAFAFDRQRDARGEERTSVSGKTAMGTAAHETIARALSSPQMREKLLSGEVGGFSAGSVRRVIVEEYERATRGLEVRWYGRDEYEDTLDDVEAMVAGLFKDLHRHVRAVELVEAGFINQVGDIWTEGHVDLVYRPRGEPEDALGLTDWKTGAQKPHQIVLDHGWESGFYSAALQCGLFLPVYVLESWRALAAMAPQQVPLDQWDAEAIARVRPGPDGQREAMHIALRGLARRLQRGEEMPPGVVRFGKFPEVIRLTHLADYCLYQKAGKKKVDRPEEIEHWKLEGPGEVKFEKGQQKGPAWYRVRRTADDIARLEHLLRAVVGWVRFGKFVESVGEKCVRCSHRDQCLTSGYALRGDAAKALNAALKDLDFEGLGDLDD